MKEIINTLKTLSIVQKNKNTIHGHELFDDIKTIKKLIKNYEGHPDNSGAT